MSNVVLKWLNPRGDQNQKGPKILDLIFLTEINAVQLEI